MFHKRQEDDGNVTITLYNWPRIAALAAFIAAALVNDDSTAGGRLQGTSLLLFCIGFGLMVLRRVRCRHAFGEIAAAMKAASVEMSGSMYHPLGSQNYRIRKRTHDH